MGRQLPFYFYRIVSFKKISYTLLSPLAHIFMRIMFTTIVSEVLSNAIDT